MGAGKSEEKKLQEELLRIQKSTPDLTDAVSKQVAQYERDRLRTGRTRQSTIGG
jgi:hypothetical protein